MKETKRRSIVKGLTYRVMATLATFTVAFLFTGDISSSVQIGLADFIVKLTLFFVNERLWARVTWGIKPVKN